MYVSYGISIPGHLASQELTIITLKNCLDSMKLRDLENKKD